MTDSRNHRLIARHLSRLTGSKKCSVEQLPHLSGSTPWAIYPKMSTRRGISLSTRQRAKDRQPSELDTIIMVIKQHKGGKVANVIERDMKICVLYIHCTVLILLKDRNNWRGCEKDLHQCDRSTVMVRMEVAYSRPDYLPTMSAAKSSKLSLLVKHHILAIDEAN